jgi:hypothetical protein
VVRGVSFSSRASEDDIFDDTTSTVYDVKFDLDISHYHDPHANGDFNTMRQRSSPAVLVVFLLVSLGDYEAFLKRKWRSFCVVISNTDAQSKSMMRTMFARSSAVPL